MEVSGIRGNKPMEQTEQQVCIQRQLDEQRQLWIDTLSHARHDWLNDLQLILGYVQLRKYDKIADCVDMLKRRMAEESRAAKLGSPGIIEALLTHRTRPRSYDFVLAIEESIDFRLRSRDAEAVEAALRRLLSGFEQAAGRDDAHESANELLCAFGNEAGSAVVWFTYRGAYHRDELRQSVNEAEERLQSVSPSAIAVTADYRDNSASVKMTVPLSG